jgi:arsenite-transporting ATPase
LRLLRLPDAMRWFMENFFQLERSAARLVRPLADRVGAGRFVAPDTVFAAVERLYEQIRDVRETLLDAERTSARLVVNPARVVVEETRRSFAYLSLYGVATDAILVNRVLPADAAGGYFATWAEREARELAEIERSFPLPIFRAPLRPEEPIGPTALAELARALYGERDPAALFARAQPVRLEKRATRTVLAIDLPGIARDEIDVAARGGDLLLSVRDAQRVIALPHSVAGRGVETARLEAGVLEVEFRP